MPIEAIESEIDKVANSSILIKKKDSEIISTKKYILSSNFIYNMKN